MVDFDIFESKLDTARFGFKIGKINDESYLGKISLEDLKNKGFELIIARCNSTNIPLVNELENKGFRTKDVQLTYKYDLQKLEETQFINKELSIRKADVNDLDVLKRIAAESFGGYGHYFANDKLDKSKSLDIYIDWTDRSITDSAIADVCFLAEQNGEILGYLSFKEKQVEQGLMSYGGIGAVSKNVRGKNVFPTLAMHGLLWGKSRNHIWQEHNVLNTNFPVNRAFSKMGFYIYKSDITLHCWL